MRKNLIATTFALAIAFVVAACGTEDAYYDDQKHAVQSFPEDFPLVMSHFIEGYTVKRVFAEGIDPLEWPAYLVAPDGTHTCIWSENLSPEWANYTIWVTKRGDYSAFENVSHMLFFNYGVWD